MPKLDVSLACGGYLRTKGLWDGSVVPNGVRLSYVKLTPPEIFWRMLRFEEFDVSEMSLSAFLQSVSRDEGRFVGVPVFPARMFRHAAIFINADSGIEEPEDLRGRRIGLPEYHMTAAMFVRGMLADEHEVQATEIQWVQGGQEEPGRVERVSLGLPPDIALDVETDRSLNEMLLAGDIDALITPFAPSGFRNGSGRIRRLFSDPIRIERDYHRRTGIFPIMHIVVLRKAVADRHPWLVESIYDAFEAAKQQHYADLRMFGEPLMSFPWFDLHLEEVLRDFGEDFWPYGVEPNRHVLELAARYSFEQAISARVVGVEELFPESCLDRHVD